MDHLFITIFINQRDDLKFVFKFRKVCKTFKNISEEWLTELVDAKYLFDVDVAQFRNLRKLQCNDIMLNKTIRQLNQLTYLDAFFCRWLNDAGIKNLKLTTLISSGYSYLITDDGIKHMNLEELCVNGNLTITDNGIKKSQNVTFLDLRSLNI